MAAGQHNNAAGVRKYFFFIKESVSSDWKDLAFHLDFRRSDTDNIAGRNRDDKSRCMDLLEEWLKRNGERATIEVLMEALSEAKLQSTVDGLRDEYPELIEFSRQSDDRGLPNTPPFSQGICPRPETSCSSEHASEVTKYVGKRKGAEERQMSESREPMKLQRKERREYDNQDVMVRGSAVPLDCFCHYHVGNPTSAPGTGQTKATPRAETVAPVSLDHAVEQSQVESAPLKETERLSMDRLDQDTERFRDAVKSYYDATITTFKPAIWNDKFTLRLSDIFTNLELSKNPTEGKESKRTMLNSLDDLYKSEVTGRSTAPRSILIEGEAGGGKTTFLSKEALDAVSQKTKLGRRHDIVLLIRLREVWEGEAIEEMVWDQCVSQTTEGVDVQSIKAILQRNESRVLFLLDGYDELRPEARAARQAIPKLLSGKMYLKSTIVITSRPSAGVQQYTQPNCHVHIMGFSPEHVTRYVRQYFDIVGNAQVGEKLISVLKESRLVTDLLHTPIFVMLVCVLWKENPDMVSPGTMTGLYSNLLTCLGRKHCKREGVDMPTDGLPTDLADALLQIGKLALEALLRGETLLDVSQAEKEHLNWKLLLKLGVISLEISASTLNPREQLNFSHKTMQEFLAGRYVTHALVNQDIAELLQLTSISKALEHRNLLQFTCGCDSRAAKAVMEELSNLSSKEFSDLNVDALRMSLAEADNDESVRTYRRFVLLCFDILNERKEPDVLEALRNALPVIIIEMYLEIQKSPAFELALKYYLENLESLHLSNRMIISMNYKIDVNKLLQWLEQIFTSSVPGLQLYLDLEEVSLDSPDQTARLALVLKNVSGLRALNLSNTNLTPALLRPLVQGFHHMPLLEELDLSWNDELGDAVMEVLQAGLSSVPHLTVLRLRDLKMTAAGMSLLTPHLRHLAGLRELDLSENISDTGLSSLTTILPTFIAMQVLNLARTGISPKGMRTLVPALRKLTGLIKLDISSNNIGDIGLECFSAILPCFKAMKVLGLSCIGISPKGMVALVAGLCKLTGLIKLDISYNDIKDPGLECLAAILPRLIAMKVLVHTHTRISDRGISALVKTLPHLVQLQELDVSNNDIGDSGIVSLVQTLCQPSQDMEQNLPSNKSEATAPRYNTTLQRLDIGRNSGVAGAGLGRVAQLISALPALTRLDMSGPYGKPTHLSDSAAMALAEALPRLPALEELRLWHISMDPVGFQAVVQAAEEHPTLERLWYSSTGVPEGVHVDTGPGHKWNIW